MRRPFALALIAAALAATAPATLCQAAETAAAAPVPAKPMDAAERKDVIEDLAKKLEDNFVFPEVGARYAAMLRANLARGAYDGLTDPDAFGKKVTADLQAVASDGHLRLATMAYWNAGPVAPPKPSTAGAPAAAPAPVGLEEAKMIGQVAYLRFNLFPDDPETVAGARDFLIAHADAKAVIIDARGHHGGGLAVMDGFLPLLYAKPTLLVRMDTRASVAGDMPDYPSLVRQASPASVVRYDQFVTPDTHERRLQSVPVYYLTSKKTASAAEHLALVFKRTHRAVLIGETTRGAGHFGGVPEIGARFGAFIPVGRTYDPDTNWDWEGKGVAPDVAVPADQALDEALKLAGAAGAQTER